MTLQPPKNQMDRKLQVKLLEGVLDSLGGRVIDSKSLYCPGCLHPYSHDKTESPCCDQYLISSVEAQKALNRDIMNFEKALEVLESNEKEVNPMATTKKAKAPAKKAPAKKAAAPVVGKVTVKFLDETIKFDSPRIARRFLRENDLSVKDAEKPKDDVWEFDAKAPPAE